MANFIIPTDNTKPTFDTYNWDHCNIHFQSITPMPTNRLQQYEEIDMNNTLTILNDHNNNVR